jgi:HEAT repeat protein
MDDADPSVALAAAHALDLMHDDSAYNVYYQILTGQRKAAKGLLASQTSFLKDPKKMAQLGFQEGIGFIPFAGIGWQAFKIISKDDSSPVRAAAAKVLTRDPDPATSQALTEAVGDDKWLVRTAAVEALAQRGDVAALEAIQPYMWDENEAVRYTAAAAVIRLTTIKETANAAKRTKDKKSK